MSETVQEVKLKKKDIKRKSNEILGKMEVELDKLDEQYQGHAKELQAEYDVQKSMVIKDTATYLKSIVPQEEHINIASKMWKQLKGKDYISKAWLYRQIPEDCRDSEKSAEISRGRSQEKSTVDLSATADTSSQPDSFAATGQQAPKHTQMLDEVEAIIAEIKANAILDGNEYRIPRELMDKLFSAVLRVPA